MALFDVVIYNAPLSDVTFHSQGRRADLQQDQGMNLLIHLTRTIPGRFLAAALSRDVLDDPQSAVREAVAALGDVLGVVRLPDGALPASPGARTSPTCSWSAAGRTTNRPRITPR